MWHGYEINQPFVITFSLPEPNDKRRRGYSEQFIKELQKKSA